MKKIIALVMVIITAFSVCSCKSDSGKLSGGIPALKVDGIKADDTFKSSQLELYAGIFKKSVRESEKENILISPLSVQLALAMTANGADGKTREEMERLVAGELSLDFLNQYLMEYTSSLPSGEDCKVSIANSIWFRDDEGRFAVQDEFLQKNATFYKADIFSAPFDQGTVKNINGWVKDKTDKMIDKIVDKIDEDTVMYLINALTFDAKWQKVYNKNNITNGSFTSVSGENQNVKMMHSEESEYIEAEGAVGFKKYYKDGNYSFIAILPNEDTDVYEFASTLDGIKLKKLLSTQSSAVITQMPKFSYEYEISMNNILKELGMPTGFDSVNADFSKLGTSSRGNIYISEVLHKTFIAVDELGTKAGAVTKVEITDESAPLEPPKTVILDRPFIYMIADEQTGLPIFMGIAASIG